MGPDDWLKMYDGYQLRLEHEDRQAERELYLLRQIAYTVHNAVATRGNKIQHPAQLMPLEIDKHIDRQRKQTVAERKEAAKALYEKARQRGVLDENNEVISEE